MKKTITVLILGIAIIVPIKQIFASESPEDTTSYCSEGYKNEVDTCTGGNCYLYEFYYDDFGVLNLEASSCAGGCESGTCIIDETTTFCTDSDGENYYTQGETISNPDTYLESKFSDYCSAGYKNPVDSCSGEHCYLFEHLCNEDESAEVEAIDCINGCSEGACIETGEESTTSSSVLMPPAGYEDVVITNPGSYENPFSDTDIETLEGQAASELYRRGIIGGYPDGEFKGNKEVNRAEAAKFLLYTRYETVEDETNNGQFSDVLDGQWYTKFVVTAANMGIINGYSDNTFKPANTVNTAEFLKMLTLTFDLEQNLPYSYTDVSETDWFTIYAGIAEKYNLFPNRSENTLLPAENLTREEVAIAIYQYLTNR